MAKNEPEIQKKDKRVKLKMKSENCSNELRVLKI